MAEKVLSQDEIEALFSAMSEGQIETETDKEDPKNVSLYDLTSQKVRLLENLDLLDEVHDKFAGFLKTTLSVKLRTAIEADFISTEVQKFSEFIKGFSKPTGFIIFDMEPLAGSGMLVIVSNLVFSMIDCLFGGKGKPLDQMRDFTVIEQRVVRRVSTDILQNLEKAWDHVHSVRITVRKTESNPEFIRMYTSDDIMFVVGYSVTGTEFSGNIYLCIPYLMLEPIKGKLSSKTLHAIEPGKIQHAGMKEILKDTEVDLSVELGKATQKLGDILNLKVGDVLWLNNGPRDTVSVLVEKIPKFRGIAGVVKEKRAIRISSVIT